MRKLSILFAISIVAILSSSCEDHLKILFDDWYVCVKDENDSQSSFVPDDADGLVGTYYFYLVSEERKTDLIVNYELVVGDGLKEGVDFECQNASNSVTFAPGIYKRPMRIRFLKHPIDPTKDNTIKIKIVSTSDQGITIGYPGPSAKFSYHTITKNKAI